MTRLPVAPERPTTSLVARGPAMPSHPDVRAAGTPVATGRQRIHQTRTPHPRTPRARTLHPWAWWGWALCAAAAVSLGTNPLLTVLCVAAVLLVVVARRTRAPWARAVKSYLVLAGVILGMRMVLQMVLGRGSGSVVLFTLPYLELPDWLAALHIGGPVTLDALLYTLYDSLRLGAILVCVGAANTLANPRRALKNVPAALHEVSTAVVIALSVAPQLIESGQRVRVARRLRGTPGKGMRALRSILVPILEDSIERSMALAGSMESRGYGRTLSMRPLPRTASALLLGGMMALVMGTFLLLGIPGSLWPALALLVAGLGAVVLGLRTSGRRLAVSHYRPDPWLWPETLTVGCGIAALALVIALYTAAPASLQPPTSPPQWPTLHPVMPLVALLLALPAVATPAPGKDDL